MTTPAQMLAAAIEADDVQALRGLNAHFPVDLLNAVAGLMSSGAAPAAWRALAQGFARLGLEAAAPACLTRAAALCSAAADRAEIIRERALRRVEAGDHECSDLDFRIAARLAGDPDPGSGLCEYCGDGLRIVSADMSPVEHAALRDAVIDHPLRGDPVRDPWNHKPLRLGKVDPVAGGAWDRSFLVVQGDAPVLHVECAVEGDGPISCLQIALCFTPLGGAPDAAFQTAIRHLEALARSEGAPFILTECSEDSPAPVRDWVRAQGGARRRMDWAWIDLHRDDAAIMADFRQTHRQQARWGLSHLEMIEAASEAAYDAYADLCRTAGREPPPWDELAPLLESGRAEINVARLDGRAVCGQIITRHGATAYYSAGAALRMGAKPLAHGLLVHGMRRARAAGATRFHLGALHADEAFSDKLRRIALFKRGFVKNVQAVEWVAVRPSA